MRAIHAILPAVLALLALQRPAVAEEHRELGPHVHGQSALDIAIDGTSVAIELTAPGMDIVGFEYPAESAADRARVDAARKTLGDPLTLFVLPAAARCRLDRASVEEAVDNDEDEKDAKGRGHSEFSASYGLTCAAPAEIRSIEFGYFKAFPGAQQVNLNLVSDSGQSAYTVRRAQPLLRLR
jgi:hypothetical protein